MARRRKRRISRTHKRDYALRALRTISMPTEWGFVAHKQPGRGSAHIWVGNDTACRLWSTGGLVCVKSFEWMPEPDRKVCKLCDETADDWPFPPDPRYL